MSNLLGRALVSIEGDDGPLSRSLDTVKNKATGMQGVVNNALGTAAGFAAATAGMQGVAGAFDFLVGNAADFEAALDGVQAATGATEEDMASMRKEALRIGKDTAKSASEAVEAMGELAKAGMDVETILNGGADAAVNLALATGIDVPRAAILVSNALNTFSEDNLSAADAANIFARAANASAIDVNDLGMSLSAVGPVAAANGLSMQDFAVAMGLFGNNALRGSDAGTSLKAMLSGLTPASDKAKDSMKALGFSAFDAQGNFLPMPQIIANLKRSLEGMTEAQRAATLELWFGSDGVRAANILLKEGTEGWDNFTNAMAKAPDVADQAATRMSNFKGAMEQLRGSLETISITIGTALLPALTAIALAGVSGLNALIEVLNDPTLREVTGLIGEGFMIMAKGLETTEGKTAAAAAALYILLPPLLALAAAVAPGALLVLGIAAVAAAIGLMSAPLDSLSPKLLEVRLKFDEFALGVLKAADTLPNWVQRQLGVKEGIDKTIRSLELEIDQINGMIDANHRAEAADQQLEAAQLQVADSTQTATDRLRDLIAAHLDATGPQSRATDDLWRLYDAYIASGGSAADLGFAVDSLTGAISQADGATISADEAMRRLIEAHQTATGTANDNTGAEQGLAGALGGELVGAANNAGGALNSMGSTGAGALSEIESSAWSAISALKQVQYAVAAVGTTATAAQGNLESLASLKASMESGGAYADVYQARAGGGTVMPGTPYVVGEEGWEFFIPDTPGRVLSHEDSLALLNGEGAGVNVYMPNAEIIAWDQRNANIAANRIGYGVRSALSAVGA